MSRNISDIVERKIYSESMGRCMNPACKTDLFNYIGDIIERAHIIPYSKTKDNSYENLVILCPNCHTNFDKNKAFKEEEVKEWKSIRTEDLKKFFNKKFENFEELNRELKPLLLENKNIYENYFLNDDKNLWDLFEGKILSNNRLIKGVLKKNIDLIQSHDEDQYSNLKYVNNFLAHIDEFELTRPQKDKSRRVLFQKEINSLFGIEPIDHSINPSVESLEALICKLKTKQKLNDIILHTDNPHLSIFENGEIVKLYLMDAPRIRQYYHDYKCFRKMGVRLNSLLFALKYLKSNEIDFRFINDENLREIEVNGTKIIFIYEYCLGKLELIRISPKKGSVIVNLHNWNGSASISNEAYMQSKILNITLLTMDNFYKFVYKI